MISCEKAVGKGPLSLCSVETSSFSDQLSERVEAIGLSLHQGRMPRVGKSGEVLIEGFDERIEKENGNAKFERKRRSSARSRKRTQRGQRASDRSRAARARSRLRSGTSRQLYSAGIETLATEYDCQVIEERHGIWVAVESYPLGDGGPSIHFLIAFPFKQDVMPRAWAFASVGPRMRSFGFRHTNVPDQSVCAFSRTDRAWDYSDGLVAFIDLLSLWAAKQFFFMKEGWWPGRQHLAGALYRRETQSPIELCGCGSGSSYLMCHQNRDAMASQKDAEAEYMQLFRAKFGSQAVPAPISEAARTRWKELPTIELAYSFRPIDPVRA